MKPEPSEAATMQETTPAAMVLAGAWTAYGLHAVLPQIAAFSATSRAAMSLDLAGVSALDTVGAWELQVLLLKLRRAGSVVTMLGMRPEFDQLLAVAAQQQAELARRAVLAKEPRVTRLGYIGHWAVDSVSKSSEMLEFIGQCAFSLVGCVAHPARIRVRPILFNVRTAGFDALPIVGLLSFLIGIVIAYQGADQLRQYGASIFVVDLVSLSVLREFSPLITAIIVAGRSGSAYAAQIGTMAVTEELDAMRVLGIAPLELLVLPKIMAMLLALPLLTVFADGLGVGGGMVMAKAQLAVSYSEFLDRMTKTISLSTYLTGLGKSLIFAVIIVVVGCYQGFQTRGGAESVGRQTTRSVVQSIFLVIVADALFSVFFSALNI